MGLNSMIIPESEIVAATATLQSRHVPVCWTNNVTAKLISSGIRSVPRLREVIRNETLNVIISGKGKPKFNKVTISGIDSTLKSDSHQGRF
jgi:deoxyhypusine synthase